MQLKLDINDDMYRQMIKRAGKDPESIKRLATRILANNLGVGTNLENQQFVGTTISGKDLAKSGGFITLGGIYYKVHLVGSDKVDSDLDYKVIGTDGNVIKLALK